MEFLKTENLVTIGTLIVSLIAGWYKLKYEVRNMTEKLNDHVAESMDYRTRMSKSIDRLYERDRKNLEDVTEIRAKLEQALSNQDRILKKLDTIR